MVMQASHLIITRASDFAYSDLFHPDNIKNYHGSSSKICISVYEFWKTYGGSKGLAQMLKTDIKVREIMMVTHSCRRAFQGRLMI